MNAHVSVITLGVRDLAASRQFYAERLGWPVQQEDDNWVCFLLGGGSSALALYPWDELAEDAAVPAEGDPRSLLPPPGSRFTCQASS